MGAGLRRQLIKYQNYDGYGGSHERFMQGHETRGGKRRKNQTAACNACLPACWLLRCCCSTPNQNANSYPPSCQKDHDNERNETPAMKCQIKKPTAPPPPPKPLDHPPADTECPPIYRTH